MTFVHVKNQTLKKVSPKVRLSNKKYSKITTVLRYQESIILNLIELIYSKLIANYVGYYIHAVFDLRVCRLNPFKKEGVKGVIVGLGQPVHNGY